MIKNLSSFCIFILLVSLFMFATPFPIGIASEDSWSTRAAMPTARAGLGVAVVNGKIYAIGGLNNGVQIAVTEEYNPVTDTWTTKKPMPTARSGFAIAVYENKIYCIGGTTGVSGFTGVTEVYDPATDTWKINAPMPTSRADLCANVVNGKIYCMGGKKYWGFDPFYQELNVTEVYDPEKNSWTTESPMPIPVFGCASAVLDGKIYVIGGSRNIQVGELATVGSNQAYDPESDAWSIRTRLPTSESYASAGSTSGVIAPNRIFLVGGSNETEYNRATYMYDSRNDLWRTVTSMPTPRADLGVAVVDDVLYAIGGINGNNWLDTIERYVPIGYGTVPAELQVLSPKNETYTSNEVQVALSVNRPTIWIGYSLDGQENVTIAGDTELIDMSEGRHSIVVYINDTFGNMVSSNTVYFSIDTFSPQILVFSPENKTYGGSDIQSVFTVDEPVSWMSYSLDGQENVTITGNATLAALFDGSHNITFYATDLVGNTGASETIYFEIAPFPIVLAVAVAVTITITVATLYLFLKRRKTTKKIKKQIEPHSRISSFFQSY